jgi:carboxypeptidase Taq
VPQIAPQLAERLAVLDDLARIDGLLGWDQETQMPPAGAAQRGEHHATLGRLHHERLTDPALGALLDAPGTDELVVRAVRRDHERARRVPAELVAEMARAGTEARAPWLAAREARDFSIFAPALERNLETRRRLAACFPEVDHPYDALLENFEPGLTTARVREVFDELRAGLVPLIGAIAQRPQPPALTGPFDVAAQEAFALEVVRGWGFSDESWRFDHTVHPFAQSVGPQDIRVTGRFEEDSLTGLFAVFHEVGHGLYEHQVDPALARTTVGGGVSLGIHESQSRLWENWVARSRPFWAHWLPVLQERLPALAGLDLDMFYAAVNRVEPSLIRVEADEATYALHVVLRFELEVALVEGSLAVADLPDAWAERTKALLGLDVPHDTVGVLQDIHWSFGEFGYFPTYALGTIVSAQLWDAYVAAHGEPDPADLRPLAAWLAEAVHRHGRLLLPGELLERATGRPLDPQPLLAHLTRKYGELYGLAA